MNNEFSEVLNAFGLELEVKDYGNGHINDTYVVQCQERVILQRINKNVFKQPELVMDNILKVTEYLKDIIRKEGGDPEVETLNVITTVEGKPYYRSSRGDYYRVYKFIRGISYDEITDVSQLYHAAKAFGKFTNMLAEYPADTLHEVIPKFHDTVNRYRNFKDSVARNASGRADSCREEIQFVLDRESDAGVVVNGLADGSIPLRVTHNDTKLNNVLLDPDNGEGVCVIDLDTVMPGSLLYDYGDALRFGGSSGAEDEKDLSKIHFVVDNFRAFTEGYIESMPSITARELELLPFSIKLMTLECGLRFLADYIDGDVYFKTAYPEHNLVRARTQFKLIRDIESMMPELNGIVKEIAQKHGH
ncbi:MAG: aminoglycoside phosphotransferase family protein [Clostridia bacterium]|nr:aminoglycoside phosphotransferase family protein [Clostridia bacterium]